MASPEFDIDERTKHVRAYDKRRRKRADRFFHWSLGMPPEEDDMNVQANRFTGITWKEMAAAGALLLGGLYAIRATAPESPPPQPQQPPAVTQPAPQPTVEPIRGKIRFWTEDGTVIEQGQ